MENVFYDGYDSDAAYILAQALDYLDSMNCKKAVREVADAIERYSRSNGTPADVIKNAGGFYIDFVEE